jgi:hypothetical protein
VQAVDRDWLIRQYAFRFVEDLVAEHGDDVLWQPLQQGVELDGARLTLSVWRSVWWNSSSRPRTRSTVSSS